MAEPLVPPAVESEPRPRDFFREITGLVVTIGFFGVIVGTMVYEIPAPNKDLFNVLIVMWGGAFVTVVGYHYGSSSGSTAKSVTIDKLVAAAPIPPTAPVPVTVMPPAVPAPPVNVSIVPAAEPLPVKVEPEPGGKPKS